MQVGSGFRGESEGSCGDHHVSSLSCYGVRRTVVVDPCMQKLKPSFTLSHGPTSSEALRQQPISHSQRGTEVPQQASQNHRGFGTDFTECYHIHTSHMYETQKFDNSHEIATSLLRAGRLIAHRQYRSGDFNKVSETEKGS